MPVYHWHFTSVRACSHLKKNRPVEAMMLIFGLLSASNLFPTLLLTMMALRRSSLLFLIHQKREFTLTMLGCRRIHKKKQRNAFLSRGLIIQCSPPRFGTRTLVLGLRRPIKCRYFGIFRILALRVLVIISTFCWHGVGLVPQVRPAGLLAAPSP